MYFSHSEGQSFHFLTLACAATVANRKKTLTLQNKESSKQLKKTKNYIEMKTRNLLKVSITCLLLGLSSCLFAGGGNNGDKGKAKPKTEEKTLVKHLNKDQFKKLVVNVDAEGWNYLGDKPCVLDFYASWCGPCRMISPFLDDLSKEFKDQVYIYKINIDEEKDLARYFGASSIPLLVFIPKAGQPQASRGALPKDEIRNAINTVLLNKK